MIKHEEFIEVCKRKVDSYESVRPDIDINIAENIDVKDIFVVWSCKTLQNSKCLISAKHKGAYYYEFTYNGDKGEIYMGVYKKVENIALDENGKVIVERIK